MTESGARIALSDGERGVLIQHVLREDEPAFNVPAALAIRGPLDVARLEESIQLILQRHDVLRSAFVLDASGGYREVQSAPDSALLTTDLSHLGADAPAAAQEMVNADARTPFDLASGVPARFMLIRTGDEDFVLCWNIHHIAYDAWSKHIFARELSDFYNSDERVLSVVSSSQSVPVFHPVGDREESLRYWSEELSGIDALPLLVDSNPQMVGSNGTVVREIALSVERSKWSATVDWARANGYTDFMILHAAFIASVAVLSGNQDIVTNVPVSRRMAKSSDSSIGFHVNVMAVRSRLPENPSLGDIARSSMESVLDGLDHQAVSFQDVIRASTAAGHHRDLRAAQQLSITYQNVPHSLVELRRLSVTRFPVDRVDIRYEMEVQLWDSDVDGSLEGRFIYRADIFSPQFVRALVAQFTKNLDSFSSGDTKLPLELPASRPVPDASRGEASSARVDAPHVGWRPIEAEIAEVWSGLLGSQVSDGGQSFFEAGGNSLLVAILVREVRARLGVDFTVRDVFRDPTVFGMARAVDGRRDRAATRPE